MKYFAACGSRVTSPTGKIRSPFWPGYYPIKRSCSYIIDSASGSNVVLDFMNLNLVKTGTCEDYIQVKKITIIIFNIDFKFAKYF